MAISVVQAAGFAANSTTPQTVNAPSNFTVGNFVVLLAMSTEVNGCGVSSPAVTSFTQVVTSHTFGTAELYYGQVTTSGQTAVTVSDNIGHSSFPSVDIIELAGVDTGTPVLTSGSAGLSGTGSLSCPSLSATGSGQFYIGGGYHGQGVPTGNSPTAGFTALMGCVLTGSSYDCGLYQVTTGAGALAPAISAGGTGSGDVVAAIFNAAAPVVAPGTNPVVPLPLFLMLTEELN